MRPTISGRHYCANKEVLAAQHPSPHAHRMQWTGHFAKRTGLMQRSAVREFIKVTSKPGMISFAGGLPAMEALPADEIRSATDAVLRREGSRALQYGPSEGVPELREWIAKHASKGGSKVSVENVAIMN